jgi:hypothetical protein
MDDLVLESSFFVFRLLFPEEHELEVTEARRDLSVETAPSYRGQRLDPLDILDLRPLSLLIIPPRFEWILSFETPLIEELLLP